MEYYAIRTSDRLTYRRCRRLWDYSSGLRRNLSAKEHISPNMNMLFGSAIHFALEDYHGYNRFGDCVKAFYGFVEATKLFDQELIELGEGMLRYYRDYWLPKRNMFTTVVINGEPQVEVKFRIELPIYDKSVIYEGTFDRLVTDEDGLYWVVDYKTAARFNTSKLSNDTQISAYCWAAEIWYNLPIAGLIMIQMVKAVPESPKTLKNGELSVDQRQKTTHQYYKDALEAIYGTTGKWDKKYYDFLDTLHSRETFEGDDFIRFDKVERSVSERRTQYRYILEEASEMINQEIAIYPNATRDCSWDCSFFSACLLEDGEQDVQGYLDDNFDTKGGERDWRQKIKWPQQE